MVPDQKIEMNTDKPEIRINVLKTEHERTKWYPTLKQ